MQISFKKNKHFRAFHVFSWEATTGKLERKKNVLGFWDQGKSISPFSGSILYLSLTFYSSWFIFSDL